VISDDLTFGLEDLESAGCIKIPGPGPSIDPNMTNIDKTDCSAHGLMMFDVWDALPKCQFDKVCCIPFSMFFDKSDDVLNFQFLQMMI
jgi:hypothetical protein